MLTRDFDIILKNFKVQYLRVNGHEVDGSITYEDGWVIGWRSTPARLGEFEEYIDRLKKFDSHTDRIKEQLSDDIRDRIILACSYINELEELDPVLASTTIREVFAYISEHVSNKQSFTIEELVKLGYIKD